MEGAGAAQLLRGLPFPIPTRNRKRQTDRTTMNETPRHCRRARGRRRRRRQTSRTTARVECQPRVPASSARPAERPSFFERLTGLFRQRNGSSLREDSPTRWPRAPPTMPAFSPGERAMLNNILRLREVRVEDVMVPRADIEAVEIDTTLGELLIVFEQSGHSRMPVYAETLDDPRGMVHIRDVLAHITTRRPRQEGPRDDAQAAGRRRARPRQCRSDQDDRRTQPDPHRAVRAALDAGLRPDGAHAGDPHPDGAGHRRIWRHRRAGLAGGHRRDGRRRHRGRA